jgi:molybdate transport repressor ModE-like protein
MSSRADRIELMRLFVRIADTGSMSAAARTLGLSQPSSSRLLKQLEDLLGVHLVKRSTHDLVLTDAGERFLPFAIDLLNRWDEAAETAWLSRDAYRGPIRIAAPAAIGQTILADLTSRFLAEHPGITIDWRLTDNPGDLAAGGYDVWIRAGPIRDQALIVHVLQRGTRTIVAKAPYPCVEHPDDLAERDAVQLVTYATRQIPLRAADGRIATLRLKPVFTTDSLYAAFSAVLHGVGYGMLPHWLVAAELARGTMVEICPQWRPPEVVLHVAYPQARYRPERVKLFVDYLRAASRRQELIPQPLPASSAD